jgi:hypothetical protein
VLKKNQPTLKPITHYFLSEPCPLRHAEHAVMMTTKTMPTKSALTALLLLVVAAFVPACDVFNPNPCDPSQEVCPRPPTSPTTIKSQ